MEMDTGKKKNLQELGCLHRSPGGSVPAPGRSTPEASGPGGSSQGQTVEWPTGSTADMTGRTNEEEAEKAARMEGTPTKDGEVAETETPKLQRKRGSNKELRLLLVRTGMEDINQGGPTKEVTKPDMAMGARRSLRPKMTRSVEVKYPKETRIRVVGGEIIDSPVAESSAGTPMGDIVPMKKKTIDCTAVTSDTGDSGPYSRGTLESMSMTETENTENTESSFEEISRKGKKRGRKPKGSNAPGVNVAKIAIQRLASDIAKSAGPVDEVRSSNLALEREVLKLRRELDILRREKTALKDQVETLTRTVQDLRDKEERGRPGLERVSHSQIEEEIAGELSAPTTRKKKNQELVQTETDETSEALLPPVYRPMLGGVQRRIEERSRVRTSVDVTGRIVTSARERTQEEQRNSSRAVRAGETHRRNSSLSPGRDYPSEGEPWTKAKSKKALKRARRKERGKIASETEGRREAAPEKVPRPRRDKNPSRTVKAATGEVPGGRTGATTRTVRKISARLAGGDSRFRAHRTAAVLLRKQEATPRRRMQTS
ncbi:hypothetical protein ALC57_13313 [Trachymyrmex cornetzi]|uniref:Uncharacterized protein n=1 Tax=Trachymyrmex cornetzi TaxID=471704 RepID=A0A151IZU7_9HYME|nr:hypothetical protein ALC57_13313 [Trachymyrmex cornetzi]